MATRSKILSIIIANFGDDQVAVIAKQGDL